MKYTLDSPDVAFEAFVADGRISNKVLIGRLLPLPNAKKKTLNVFDDYAKEAWAVQPEYCAFSDEHGTPIYKWKGKSIDDSNPPKPVGILEESRIPGEISSIGASVKVIKLTNAKVRT